MNSRVSLPPISDILSNNGHKSVSVEDYLKAHAPSQPAYQYCLPPVLIHQVPLQPASGIPILNGTMMAAPATIATSPMSISQGQNSMYPMVPMPSYRLINPNFHACESPQLANSSFTYRYPNITSPQQKPLHNSQQPHSAQRADGSALRALIVLKQSAKASTPISPSSFECANKAAQENVPKMVRRPTPPPPVRSRTRNNLPKETTYILLKWLEEHLNHPYPNSFEKTQLMFSTGLNQQQLSNWFINARRRKIRAMKQKQKV